MTSFHAPEPVARSEAAEPAAFACSVRVEDAPEAPVENIAAETLKALGAADVVDVAIDKEEESNKERAFAARTQRPVIEAARRMI